MDTYHFCDREETQRGSVAESGTGGLINGVSTRQIGLMNMPISSLRNLVRQ